VDTMKTYLNGNAAPGDEKERLEPSCDERVCIASQTDKLSAALAEGSDTDSVGLSSGPIEGAEDVFEYTDNGPIREDEDMASLDPPIFIKKLIEDIEHYLLPGECKDDFLLTFDTLEDHFKTKNLPEYVVVMDCTILVWEVLRYRRVKIGVIRNHQRNAAESLFRKSYEGHPPKDAARRYFSDPIFREESRDAFEAAGFSRDAVEVEAFSRSLPALAEIERQIASAQKRIATFMKDLERRYAERGARLARAAWKAALGLS
jgi:hypothetical protein